MRKRLKPYSLLWLYVKNEDRYEAGRIEERVRNNVRPVTARGAIDGRQDEAAHAERHGHRQHLLTRTGVHQTEEECAENCG